MRRPRLSHEGGEQVPPGQWVVGGRQSPPEAVARLSRADAGNVLRLLAPDIGMALLGLVISTLSHKLVRPPGNMASSCSNTLGHGAQEVGGEEEEDAKTRDSDSEDDVASSRSEDSAEPAAEATGTSRDCVPKVTAFVLGLKAAMEPFSSSMGKVLVTLLLGLAGMVVPSLPSAVYFGAFLGLGSWWACGQALSAMAFSMLCVFMAVFTAGHLTSLYLYQLPFLQNLVPPNDIYARLLGMTALTRTNRTEPWRLLLQPDSDWPEMVHPLILLLSYYTLVLLLPQWAPQSGKQEEEVEVLSAEPGGRSAGLGLRSVLCVSGCVGDQGRRPHRCTHLHVPRRLQVSLTDSRMMTVRSFLKGSGQELPAVHHEQRQGQSTGPDAPPPCGPERRITFPGPTGAPTESAVPGSGPSSVWVVGHLATRHSYVTAPIAMMVWSVTHTSWLGFILLLWACVIWMVRDRRHLALFSAPCLVLYADLLVLLTFVVGLRLSPDELFPGVPDWLLVDLDLMPYPRPCLHLCAKSLYTSVFWSLLRQKVLERRGLVAAEDQGQREDCGEASGLVWPGSTLLDTLGSFLKGLLAKYWIFVCTAMFFLVSFRGKVVAYKVIYVTLFLSWVALYQMHYESWRRILKPFWVVMVSYSMVVLVAVYTYQFQSMAGFFNKTLGLSEEGLGEVGLQRFDTAELFAETTLPAVFLLLCILQLHYFHEDFLETTSLQSAPGQRRDTPGRLGEVGLQRFDTAELFAETTLPAVFLLLCILQLHYFHEDFLETTSLQSAPGQRRDTPGRDYETLFFVNIMRFAFGFYPVLFTPGRKRQGETGILPKASRHGPPPASQAARVAGPCQACAAAPESWPLASHGDPALSMSERPSFPPDEETSDRDSTADKLTMGFLKLLELVKEAPGPLWGVLETHMVKLVSLVVIWLTLQEVSLMNSVFYVLWVVSLPCSTLRPYASCVSTAWACVVVFCKTVFQLQRAAPTTLSSSCLEVWQGNRTHPPAKLAGQSALHVQPADLARWLGFRKCDGVVLPCLQNQLAILALMTLEVTVSRHQRFCRLQTQLAEPPTGAVTDTITRAHLDHGLKRALQYFVNYGFYKFGLELCFVAALNAIGQRMDLYALVHAICLIYLLNLRRRKAIAEAWPRYCGFLISIMVLQYFLCLGLPPAFCRDYPWRTTSTGIHANFIKWLYLPDFAKTPDANLLLFDFLLLLVASLQWQVFVDENRASVRVLAGDNVEVGRQLRPEDLAQLSPVPNFIFCRSYLDLAKVAVFRYHFWFVLCLVFLTGTTRISIWGAGYLVAFGYFMLHGHRLLLRPVKFILKPLDRLIAYSVLVVAVKTALSVGACVYLEALLVSHCWLVHSLGLYCTVEGYRRAIPEDEPCEPPKKEAGILWDAVCFTFLLLQRRVFLSYYHLFVVADLEATEALAGRGRAGLKEGPLWAAQLPALSSQHMLPGPKVQQLPGGTFDCILTLWREGLTQRHRPPAIPYSGEDCIPEPGGAELLALSLREALERREEVEKKSQLAALRQLMTQDGSYSLFETDSEEEEEPEGGTEAGMGDSQPKPSTAFQLMHRAWTNGFASALTMRCPGKGGTGRGVQEDSPRRCGGGERLATHEAEVEAKAGNPDGPESTARRLQTMARFSWLLGQVVLDDVTAALGTLSRERDSVAAALRVERCAWWHAVSQGKKATRSSFPRAHRPLLQETPTAGDGSRSRRWQLGSEGPLGSLQLLQGDARLPAGMEVGAAGEGRCRHAHRFFLEPPREEQEGPPAAGAGRPQLHRGSPPQEGLRVCPYDELAQSDRFYGSLPRLVKLALALGRVATAQSELLCYLVIVLNHTLSASIFSMVLPILCFLWAMLSVPRPSKRFWTAAIYYTEVTVVVKYFSQFGFFPWTTKRYAGISGEKPFSLPNILGIEKRDGYALCDLLQLLALCSHRSALQDLGLWDQPPTDHTHCQEESSRKQTRKAGQGSLSGDHLERPAELNPDSRERPLQPPAHHGAHRRASWAAEHRGDPQDPRPKKRWSLLTRKQLSRRRLRRQLAGARTLALTWTLETYCAIRCFFFNLTHPQASPVCDVYALTFLVEVLVFAIVLFGYWAFGKYSAADLAESLSEDKVPEAFLTMVLAQFGTMMVDRALYLRKTLVGKCVFQVLLVLGTHCWLFFILPGVTERRFHLNSVAQAWYLVKCVYFGLSAYQIKCGYPNRILGNFLTKNFNLLNLFLFKGFRMVPFLLELRAVADWVWTDTALSLSNWVCLEDLYANIFILKCWRESEKKYPQPPGQKKKKTVKYGVGGVLAFALVSLMWFPLVFMSLLKTVGGVTNQPLDVSVKVAINGYETLFSMNAQQQNLVPFSDADYDQLIERYALHPPAMQFLVNYRPEDIVLAKVKSQASLLWGISPAHRAALVRELANASSVYATVSWAIRRNVSLVTNVEAAGQHTVYYTDAGTRERLVHMLTRARAEPVMLPGLIPKALRTTAGTEAKMAHRLDVAHSHRPQEVDQLAFFRNATVRLQRLRPMDVPESEGEGHPAAEWWMVQEWRPACDQNRGCGRDLELVIYNDKVSPQSLNFLAGYGIVGLYVSVVLVAAKFIREHFLGASRSLMQEELPCVDRLLRLCSSIFLVRELGAFELEQQLFAKLVFLYRSPETMIRWTRERPPASRRRPLLDPDSGAAAGPGEAILAS
ncbi:piezo-type mechanosensitive ion channel component 2 [Tupaia chinensis]|uniref:piezo-type mechanosensitive ion channel component 2 n=1 Tax=Tupaia chinensis TaxID=246437 RepID=UPI000FFB64F5|nr:piezo-type mechanosensitive ion channel component 2 [Tupaia chinensis]